jgi:aminopeptidase N
VYSAFDTCHWMVCRDDRPGDKAPLTLSIAAPPGHTVVASGVPSATRDTGDGRQWHVWKEAVPSSAYLYGFAMGKFSRTARTHRGTSFEYYVTEPGGLDAARMATAFADDDRMLDFFIDRAGIRLPRPFYRQVVVDGGAAQEMSSFSILGRKLVDARLADASEDWFIAHELAHQFWGNSVTCADWTHFWLNEGITTFMVAAYKEQRWGRPAYDRELSLARKRHEQAIKAGMDVPLAFAGEYPSLTVKRAITYSKAALFLDRLRQTMGERAFWRALAAYTRRHAGGAVVSRDFQRAFAAETDQDLSALFADWVYGR